jgi:hypothetical protein
MRHKWWSRGVEIPPRGRRLATGAAGGRTASRFRGLWHAGIQIRWLPTFATSGCRAFPPLGIESSVDDNRRVLAVLAYLKR